MSLYLWKWMSRHLAVESNTHSLHDAVVFDRCTKGRLHCLLLCNSHRHLSILNHQFCVGDSHDTELDLLNDPLFKSRNEEFLQKIWKEYFKC